MHQPWSQSSINAGSDLHQPSLLTLLPSGIVGTYSNTRDQKMNSTAHWSLTPVSSRPSLRGSDVARIAVGHALIDNCSSEQVCASIIAHAQNRGRPEYVITSNAQHIVQLEKDRNLQQIYDHADLVIPDGISLLIAARLYGGSLKQRVAGVDIFKDLCGLSAKN